MLRQVEEEDVDDPDEDYVGDAGGDEDNSEDEDYKAPDSGSLILLNEEEQMRGGGVRCHVTQIYRFGPYPREL